MSEELKNTSTDANTNAPEPYKIYINKEFNLTTGWTTIYQTTFLNATNLWIRNLSGPSWIMIKIMDKDGYTLVAPNNGISPSGIGGPYLAPSNRKFSVMVKAGQAGKYVINISD